MQKLDVLSLNNNQFNGTLPTELGTLSYLKDLLLQSNQFTGIIPIELCSISQQIIKADCLAENDSIEITCPDNCCTECCNFEGTNCIAMRN